MVHILFGVSGCGKTTIGKMLSKILQKPFFDADNYHTFENVLKMKKMLALTDDECAKFNFIKGRSVNPVANGILKQIAFYKWGMPLDYKIYRVPREFTHDHNVKVQFLSCANIMSYALSRGMIFPSQKGL